MYSTLLCKKLHVRLGACPLSWVRNRIDPMVTHSLKQKKSLRKIWIPKESGLMGDKNEDVGKDEQKQNPTKNFTNQQYIYQGNFVDPKLRGKRVAESGNDSRRNKSSSGEITKLRPQNKLRNKYLANTRIPSCRRFFKTLPLSFFLNWTL